MKNPFLFVLAVSLLLSINAKSQQYQILHLKGEIFKVANDLALRTGDKIGEEEQIRFGSKDAMAAVLSTEKGRYILRPTKAISDQSDLIYVLKAAVTPVRGGMSTRAAGLKNLIDFRLYFAEAPYVWAGDVLNIYISGYAFPMNDEKYFFMRYQINDDTINKKLLSEGDNLIINKSTLFSIDGRTVDQNLASEFELFYYDSVEEESTLMTAIEFVFIDQETIQAIFNQYQDPTEDAYYKVADMLSDLYGKCDALQLRHNLKNK